MKKPTNKEVVQTAAFLHICGFIEYCKKQNTITHDEFKDLNQSALILYNSTPMQEKRLKFVDLTKKGRETMNEEKRLNDLIFKEKRKSEKIINKLKQQIVKKFIQKYFKEQEGHHLKITKSLNITQDLVTRYLVTRLNNEDGTINQHHEGYINLSEEREKKYLGQEISKEEYNNILRNYFENYL